MHFFQAIGQTLGEAEAKAYLKNLIEYGVMTEREARVASQAMSQSALDKCPTEKRSEVRADIMRHILMLLMME